jgi:hypothetical protein
MFSGDAAQPSGSGCWPRGTSPSASEVSELEVGGEEKFSFLASSEDPLVGELSAPAGGRSKGVSRATRARVSNH